MEKKEGVELEGKIYSLRSTTGKAFKNAQRRKDMKDEARRVNAGVTAAVPVMQASKEFRLNRADRVFGGQVGKQQVPVKAVVVPKSKEVTVSTLAATGVKSSFKVSTAELNKEYFKNPGKHKFINPWRLNEPSERYFKWVLMRRRVAAQEARKARAAKENKPGAKPLATYTKVILRETLNNFFVTAVAPWGKVLVSISGGQLGFKGPRRKNMVVSASIGEQLAKALLAKKWFSVIPVMYTPSSLHINAILESLSKGGVKVYGILYKVKVAHNGMRKRKPRRV